MSDAFHPYFRHGVSWLIGTALLLLTMATPSRAQTKEEMEEKIKELKLQLRILFDTVVHKDTLILEIREDKNNLDKKNQTLTISNRLLEQDTLFKLKQINSLETARQDSGKKLDELRRQIVQLKSALEKAHEKIRLYESNFSRLSNRAVALVQENDRLRRVAARSSQLEAGLQITIDSLKDVLSQNGRRPVLTPPKGAWWPYFLLGVYILLVGYSLLRYREKMPQLIIKWIRYLLGIRKREAVEIKCLALEVTDTAVVAKTFIREDSDNPVFEMRRFDKKPLASILERDPDNPTFLLTVRTIRNKILFSFSKDHRLRTDKFQEPHIDPTLAASLQQRFIEVNTK